jgi:hypothetical protein
LFSISLLLNSPISNFGTIHIFSTFFFLFIQSITGCNL